MAQQVQELIDKIKAEGVEQAEKKAKAIEAEAQAKAEGIVAEANKKAEEIVAKAKQEAQKIEGSTKATLVQASRDMLLTLRRSIEKMLNGIIASEMSASLSSGELGEIISNVAKGYLSKESEKGGVKIFLSDKDLKKLKDGFFKKLQAQMKSEISLQSSEDIDKGFLISFDGGKSSFDFSDKSLVEYLSTYLNEELSSILKEASSS